MKRQLPPPAASTVYELTEQGLGLTDVVLSLARWGHRFMDAPGPGRQRRGRLAARVPALDRQPRGRRGLHEQVYEFQIDEDVFHVVVDDGTVDAVQGPATTPPVVVVRTDLATFVQIGSRRVSAADAVADGRAVVEGGPEAVARSLEILTLGEREPVALA